MIRNLVYDFGKVLVTYDFDRIFREFFPHSEADMAEYCRIMFDSDFMDRCDKEEIPLIEIIEQEKQKYPHLATQFQLFYDRFDEFITGEMEGMYALMESLKEKGFRLYGLSNWHSKVYGVMARFPIFNLLDGRVVSTEEHIIKPDPAIYYRLCEKYDLRPEECLFADDKLVNIEAARGMGMKAVLFTTTEQYIEDLKREIPGIFD